MPWACQSSATAMANSQPRDRARRQRISLRRSWSPARSPTPRPAVLDGCGTRCWRSALPAFRQLVEPGHEAASGPSTTHSVSGAAPALVDPGTTAVWEMRLDDVVRQGRFPRRHDEIAGEADRLITVLRQRRGGTVDLSQPAPHRSRRMVAFAERLARDKRVTLPTGYDKDFKISTSGVASLISTQGARMDLQRC
jgi:hypothetical protein